MSAEQPSQTPKPNSAACSTSWRRCAIPIHGCPWDKQQSFSTIAPYTIEEAYEVADAIARGDFADLPDELGDLLFQVVYHARMAEEAGRFDFADVARTIADKMVRRHPHVFGDAAMRSAEEHSAAWEAQKHAERAGRAETGTLAGVPVDLPALTRAAKLTSPRCPGRLRLARRRGGIGEAG